MKKNTPIIETKQTVPPPEEKSQWKEIVNTTSSGLSVSGTNINILACNKILQRGDRRNLRDSGKNYLSSQGIVLETF